MKRVLLFLGLLTFASSASASTGFWSQFSHFSGGLLSTLIVAYLVWRFLPRHRAKAILYGVVFSTVYAVIDQTQQFIRHGKFWGQLYDFAAHTLGTILAYYLLVWMWRRWRGRRAEAGVGANDRLG